MNAVERYTKAKEVAEKILALAAELSDLDEQAHEYNLFFGADEAIKMYGILIEDAKEHPDLYD